MELRNLTPHPISLHVEGETITIPPTGEVARIKELTSTSQEVEIGGHRIQVATVAPGPIHGLPGPQDGVIYIVSRPVAAAAARPDVVAPDDFIRDDAGRVTAARRLVTFA